MAQPQVRGIVSACWQRVRRMFVQLAGWLKRPASTIQLSDRAAPEVPAAGRGDNRTRFWAEFRAGQREAEARVAGHPEQAARKI